MINIQYILLFSITLFGIGLFGVIVRRNLIFMLLSIEVMLNAIAVLFVAGSAYHGNADGQIMYLLILTLAAAEVAIGLGLVIHMHRRIHTLDIDQLASMRESNV